MVIWHGVLKVVSGKREEYIGKLISSKLIEKFKNHQGNVFYNIGASIEDPDTLIVCDAWENKESFIAHDSSKDVDIWREIYKDYVIDCVSTLYEF